MNCFCTISTKSHAYKVNALRDCLANFGFRLLNLVIDETNSTLTNQQDYSIHQLTDELTGQLVRKYASSPDRLRWSLKPVFLKFLLNKGYEKVVYLDNDLYFFQSPQPLLDWLDQSCFLLTPHYYESNPEVSPNWFEANFRLGLFNAGLLGATSAGIPILDWWGKACLYAIRKSMWRGLFDDQKYLDLVPVLFDKVYIIKDTGYNLGAWNVKNRIQTIGNPGVDKVVFVHFNDLTIREFSRTDHVFHSLWLKYHQALVQHNPGFVYRYRWFSSYAIFAFLYYCKWKFIRLFE